MTYWFDLLAVNWHFSTGGIHQYCIRHDKQFDFCNVCDRLRKLGLLLADGALVVGWGKTFWYIGWVPSQNGHNRAKQASLPKKTGYHMKIMDFRAEIRIFGAKKIHFWTLFQKLRVLSPHRRPLPKMAKFWPGSRKTARRAAKRPPTGKPKLSRVTSGYGDLYP